MQKQQIESLIDRNKLKRYLADKTMCTIQHDGWCCGTCFFSLDKRLTNKDWQALLLLRGDYKREELPNLPKNLDKSLIKIWEIVAN